MIRIKELKNKLKKAIFGFFFVFVALFGLFSMNFSMGQTVYAVPTENESSNQVVEVDSSEQAVEDENTNQNEVTASSDSSAENSCKGSMGAIGWFVCPITGKISEAVDFLYGIIEDALVINPVSAEDGSPIYEVWKYCRGITNIVFIIFLLIVIYSQITGLGITNYGIKKSLPKLIIAAVLVNLSFVICSLAVDISNIIGDGLRGLFATIAESAVSSNTALTASEMKLSMADLFSAVAGGAALTIGGVVIAGGPGVIWMLIPTVLGAIVAMVSGVITIALRQAVVALLVMISPLAMVANILPNTENLFRKWKDLFKKMLVFYPMFSLLFGASNLAGFAIVASADSMFGVLLGVAVQIFPLIFSWSLMRMSGTMLESVNAGIRGLTQKPLAGNRAWAESKRANTNAVFLLNGKNSLSAIRRKMDERTAEREWRTKTLTQIRQNEINAKLQRKIGAGYDGSKAQDTKAFLKPNKYTKLAKDLSNSTLASETATMDTAHTIGNYGDYYVSKETRGKVKVAEKNNDRTALKNIEKTDAEYRRAVTGANNYLEFGRAQMTAENDNEADLNFLVSKYLDAVKEHDPNAPEDDFSEYRHFIVSSAGGLGKTGQTRVLGKIIAKAASVESNQRRDINIIANKYPHMKNEFRNMIINYKTDSDGYAVDVNGKRIEEVRGWLLANDPDKLVLWDKYDEDGEAYYDWIDPASGQFVTRIYKKDKAAIKELLSNFDAPINDPINNLYGILAGVKPGDIVGNDERLKNIGLDGYRTTIARALSGFKEKNAAYSPMVKEMVARGYIQNYTQEVLAYLDSINKTAKPGAWNVQDRDAVETFAKALDPNNWEEVFPTELLRTYRNVDGEPIKGLRYDENGNPVDVPAEEATREELMNRVKEKFIKPALKKMPALTRKSTQNIVDNQKPEVAKSWGNLFNVIDRCGREVGVDPYAQEEGANYLKEVRNKFNANDPARQRGGAAVGVNHHAEVYEIYNRSLTADDFAMAFTRYCQRYDELNWVARQFEDFVVGEGFNVTKEQLYNYAIEVLDYAEQ